MGGDSVVILHVYAEYPDYHWVAAPSEGIACVDDAARAAVLLVRYATLTGDTSHLSLARGLLRFVLKLQANNGEFFNFVDSSLSINTTAQSSRKGFGFSAARAYWALATGYRFFRARDAAFANELRDAFRRCRTPLSQVLAHYGRYDAIGSHLYPLWLLQRCAADATSEFLLGAVEFLQVETDPEVEAAARKLAEGLLYMQLADTARYAGAFLSWPGVWHAWGNGQTQALAALGRMLGEPQLVSAAEREGRQFLSRLLVEGWLREFHVDDQAHPAEFPQIAYDIRCAALGLLGVAEASSDTTCAVLAGLAASWFLGNNAARAAMYDPASGRCFDGIESPTRVNRNSGAESTVEALITLLEVLNHPVARRYLTSMPDPLRECPRPQTSSSEVCRSFTRGDSPHLTLCYNRASLDFTLSACLSPGKRGARKER
ncbi:MAG: hypothetical protein QHJ34_04840 [bacterium]|jgi:hypothetical protein|nr:hypothetical protein [candidate division KSB1 bacterium]MDH7559545.1 hypothetical protein [bacterium]